MGAKDIRALRQLEVTPPSALTAAISPDLFARVRMTCIPVLLKRQPQGPRSFKWMGFCDEVGFTEQGEVVLDERCVERAEWEPRADLITSLYLHEAAHRLMPGSGHNAAFFALVLVMYLRAGTVSDIQLWQRATLYDFRDEAEHAVRAFAWAWRMANELAPTEQTAEQCAEVIAQRYKEWCAWLTGAEERKRAAQEAAQVVEQRVKEMQDGRWLWALTGFAIGAISVAVLLLR
jgi:hypothetical protein